MGTQQVLRATVACLIGAGDVASAGPAPRTHEHVAIVDLGPPDATVRKTLAEAAVAGGLDPTSGDGVEEALAGIVTAADDLPLAVAMTDAAGAFGALDCRAAMKAAAIALPILAGRQAAGLAVPELGRVWTYILLCADRAGDLDTARRAASRLRGLGGAGNVDTTVLAKYPEIDAVANPELLELEVTAEVPGAALWVDFAPAGTAPAHLVLPAGEHVIAAASGARRGAITGTVVPSQKTVAIAMPDRTGKWGPLAQRVAAWDGAVPPPSELGAVLAEVHARVALIRHGDVVEVWGRAGLAEPVRRLGGDHDGVRSVAEASQAVALIVDRVQTWSDHAPDPDRALLVETADERAHRRGNEHEAPTKWWVYAAIAGAVLAGSIVVYEHDSASDTQRIRLHYP